MKMSNQYHLKMLMLQHSLSTQDVADMIKVSHRSVKSWLYSPDKPHYRPMEDSRLDHLKCKVKTK